MPLTNLQMENAWINAWNDLDLLANGRWDVVYITPDFAELNEEDAKGWLQSSAYQGFHVTVAEVWYQGRKAIQLQRTSPASRDKREARPLLVEQLGRASVPLCDGYQMQRPKKKKHKCSVLHTDRHAVK